MGGRRLSRESDDRRAPTADTVAVYYVYLTSIL